MKRFFAMLSCVGMLVGALAAPGAAEGAAAEKLSVCASFYPMYDFASKVGGDRVEVTNMVPSGMEPHDWEPTPADIVGLERADVFVYNGAGMEHWVEDVLAALGNKDLVVVEAAQGVSLLGDRGRERVTEAPAARGASGDDGDEDGSDRRAFDPHVWLSPLNAKAQMENIKDAIVRADPDNAAYYEANYAAYAAELDALDRAFTGALAPLGNRDIVVAHQSFGYLCAAYGLNQIAIEGLSPDSEPDPARVAEIIGFGKEHDVKVIFFEELVSPRVAESIADAIGAATDVLSPIEGLSDEQQAAGDDYFAVMRQNLEALLAALQ